MKVTKRPVPQPEPPQLYTIELTEEDVTIMYDAIGLAQQSNLSSHRIKLFAHKLRGLLEQLGVGD